MTGAHLLLFGFFAIFLLETFAILFLERLNLHPLSQLKNHVPDPFKAFIDTSRLSRISAYAFQKSSLATARSLSRDLLLLMVILSGLLQALAELLRLGNFHTVLAGLLFFLLPGSILYISDLPFDFYDQFVIEEKFGFNRSSSRIWVIDQIKAGLVSTLLSSALLALLLWAMQASPNLWWLWGFLIVSAVQSGLAILFPVLIAPLFNKFTPLDDEPLADKIRALMAANHIGVSKILQMNATLRSRHTNAYFAGLGRTKQIVLFDTLLQAHPHDEILAILAHEAGHYKKGHIFKQLMLFEAALLAGFFLTYQLIGWPLLYSAFGFDVPESYVGLFFVALFWQKAGFFLRPLLMAVSRRFERQADAFSAKMLGDPRPLATALKRMAADNLANLAPHPLYVKFNYSHPPLIERVASLENQTPAAIRI